MWTTILASYAAVVSTSALIVSYLSYKSGGPQLSGSAEIYGRYDIQGPTLHVALYNRGRGPITVESLGLWGTSVTSIGGGIEVPLPTVGWPLHEQRDVLPSRIEGNSGQRLHFPATDIARTWLTSVVLVGIEIKVNLANGRDLTLRVDTSNIDILRGQELPDWQPDYFKGKPELTEEEGSL